MTAPKAANSAYSCDLPLPALGAPHAAVAPRSTRVLLPLGSLLLLAFLSCRSPLERGDDTATLSQGAKAHLVNDHAAVPLVSTKDLQTFVDFGVGLNVNHQGVLFETKERDPWTGQRVDSGSFFPTALEPLAAFGVHSHAFFVYGKQQDADVIEFWSARPPVGARFATRPLSPSDSIGAPIVTPPIQLGTSGGVFKAPVERNRPSFTRRHVYSGSAIGGVRAAVADPDGRFLLAIGDLESSLFRIRRKGGEPEVILSATDESFLESARFIHAVSLSGVGRVYVVQGIGLVDGSFALLLFDYDNDGVIDARELLSESAYAASQVINDPSEDFLFY